MSPKYIFIYYSIGFSWGFPGGVSGKKKKKIPLPMQEMQEMQVRSLGQKDSLEQEMVLNSSILAWKIPWAEEPVGLQSMEVQGTRRIY